MATFSVVEQFNSLAVRGFVYVPDNSASALDVLLLYHGTIDTAGVTPLNAASKFLSIAIDPSKLNLNDKIIFSVAYPQDAIPGFTQEAAAAMFPGLDLSNFFIGDNLAYAEAALLWAQNSIVSFLAANNITKTTKRTFTFGHSQGALLVHRLNRLYKIDGVVSNAPGPIDLLGRCEFSESNNNESATCTKLLNAFGSTSANPNRYESVSLKNYLTNLKAPCLYTQGLTDKGGISAGVPQVINMQTIVEPGIKASSSNAPTTFKYYSLGGHDAFAVNPETQEDIRAFLRQPDLFVPSLTATPVIRIAQYFDLVTSNGARHRYQNFFVQEARTLPSGGRFDFAPFRAEGSTANLNGDNALVRVLFPNVEFAIRLVEEGDGNRLSLLTLTTQWLNAALVPSRTYQERYVGIGASYSDTTIELRYRTAMDSVGAQFPAQTLTRSLVGPLPLNAQLVLQ
jgi:hypothetical protein